MLKFWKKKPPAEAVPTVVEQDALAEALESTGIPDAQAPPPAPEPHGFAVAPQEPDSAMPRRRAEQPNPLSRLRGVW